MLPRVELWEGRNLWYSFVSKMATFDIMGGVVSTEELTSSEVWYMGYGNSWYNFVFKMPTFEKGEVEMWVGRTELASEGWVMRWTGTRDTNWVHDPPAHLWKGGGGNVWVRRIYLLPRFELWVRRSLWLVCDIILFPSCPPLTEGNGSVSRGIDNHPKVEFWDGQWYDLGFTMPTNERGEVEVCQCLSYEWGEPCDTIYVQNLKWVEVEVWEGRN